MHETDDVPSWFDSVFPLSFFQFVSMENKSMSFETAISVNLNIVRHIIIHNFRFHSFPQSSSLVARHTVTVFQTAKSINAIIDKTFFFSIILLNSNSITLLRYIEYLENQLRTLFDPIRSFAMTSTKLTHLIIMTTFQYPLLLAIYTIRLGPEMKILPQKMKDCHRVCKV